MSQNSADKSIVITFVILLILQEMALANWERVSYVWYSRYWCMDLVTPTIYWLFLVSIGSSILASITKFSTSLLVISCDWLTNVWIMLSSIVSNWYEIIATFRVSCELTNVPNDFSSYSFVCFSTTMNPYMVLSPLIFIVVSSGGMSSIGIFLVVCWFSTNSRSILFFIIISSIFFPNFSTRLPTDSYPLSWTYKISSFDSYTNNEHDSLILSNSIYSSFFSLSFLHWSCNLFSYNFLINVELIASLFIFFYVFLPKFVTCPSTMPPFYTVLHQSLCLPHHSYFLYPFPPISILINPYSHHSSSLPPSASSLLVGESVKGDPLLHQEMLANMWRIFLKYFPKSSKRSFFLGYAWYPFLEYKLNGISV